MNKGTKKDILLLVTAGAVFIVANLTVLMGMQSGQVTPVDNMMLWGAFAVLSICSLLWSVSLLGLQPLVVAVSYVAGGFMAYQSVRLTPEVNIAEIATAGATYGAFGALVIGNATAKVRLAFFAKRQVPFVAIILVLLVVDGLLNSRVSNAGWHVISKAVLLPFLVCGVLVGLTWRLISKIGLTRKNTGKISETVKDIEQPAPLAAENQGAVELMFSVPEGAAEVEVAEREVSTPDVDLVITPAPVSPVAKEAPDRDRVMSDSFFPLDIDEREDQRIEENPDLMGLAAMVAQSAPESIVGDAPESTEYSAPEPALEVSPELIEYSAPEPIIDDISKLTEHSEPEPVPLGIHEAPEEHRMANTPESPAITDESTPEGHVELKTKEPDLEEEQLGSKEWLNSHLDLLKKLK